MIFIFIFDPSVDLNDPILIQKSFFKFNLIDFDLISQNIHKIVCLNNYLL
jgi:hypothetical protein